MYCNSSTLQYCDQNECGPEDYTVQEVVDKTYVEKTTPTQPDKPIIEGGVSDNNTHSSSNNNTSITLILIVAGCIIVPLFVIALWWWQTAKVSDKKKIAKNRGYIDKEQVLHYSAIDIDEDEDNFNLMDSHNDTV